jgi:uncharacterized membrane protein YccC
VASDVVANALEGLAGQLRGRGARHAWADYASAMRLVRTSLDDESAGASEDELLARQGAEHLRAISGQLRAAWTLATDPGQDDGRRAWRGERSVIADPDVARLASARDVVSASLSSMTPALRHAIRLSVAVPVSVLIATWWHLPRGYWLAFAVTVILKSDYATILRLGVGRVVGTLLGATVAALLISGLHPSAQASVVLIALLAWAAYSTWSANFSLSIGFVTALILVLLSTSLRDPLSTALDRLVEVCLGALIAAVTYLVWPTPSRAGVVAAEGRLFSSLATYFYAVAPLVHGEANHDAVIAASRSARVAWGEAEAAVGRAVVEPQSTRLAPGEAQGLLSAAMRVLRATHALRIEAERGATTPPSPELAHLVAGLGNSLTQLGDLTSVEDDDVDLRALADAAEASLERAEAPATIFLHLDELVNATNTARVLVGALEDERRVSG